MASKDQRPSQRLGKSNPRRVKIITWMVGLALCGGGAVAAYRYTGTTEVEVPVARVRRGEFIISVRTRGDIKSARSVILKAPQVPGLRIVHLADAGRPVKKGDVVVEFDGSQQDQNVISRTTTVRAADGDIVQTKATQTIDNEADAMSKMSGEYDLERAKLDASKAEVLSAIDGEKNRIQVGVSEGSLQTVKASINAHQVGHDADLSRLNQRKDKAVRDLNTAQGYLGMMQLRAPNDGIVNVLPNFRSQGSFGQATPPFKEGDNAWTGAEIAEIPDLSEMYVDLKLEEVDRGKLQTRAGRPHSRGRHPGQGIHRHAGLDQPDRGADFQRRLHRGKDLPGARHHYQTGPPAASGHERVHGDHHRTRAQLAVDSVARQLLQRRQAGGVSSRWARRSSHARSNSASRTMKTSS